MRIDRLAAAAIALAAAALGGCSAREASAPRAAAPGISPQLLVGGWVLEGQACDSDAGVIYRADGSWMAYDSSGTWRLSGRSLVTEVTRRNEAEGPDQASGGTRNVTTILSVSPNSYTGRWSDGSVRKLVRCR